MELFIRGNPYNTKSDSFSTFYLGAKDDQGNYYYLTKSTEDNTNIVFTSLNYTNIDPIIVKIVSVVDNSYNFKTQNTTISSKDNILDVYKDRSGSLKLNAVNTMLNTAYSIYPGIWYNVYDNNNNKLYWKTQKCKINSKPFCTSVQPGIENKILDIIMIPVNSDEKNYLSLFTGGGCATSAEKNIGLRWFDAWVNKITKTGVHKEDTPVNCEGPGNVSATSNNCFFTNPQECIKGSLYTTCDDEQTCGNCLGVCSDLKKPCMYDYGKNEILSCNSKNPEPLKRWQEIWQTYQTLIIIIFCVFLVLIITMITVIVVTYKKQNKGYT